jgi:uncharacterized protein YkwD
MPAAMLLAVGVIAGLFTVAAVVAPSLAPGFTPSGTDAAGAPALAGSSTPSGGAGPDASPTAGPSREPSAGVKPSTSRKPTPTPDRITAREDEVLRLANVERRKAGCGQLHMDERLRKSARDFSALMAAKNFFSHVSPDGSTFVDRIEWAGYPRNKAAAENIAYGYGSPAAVMQGWMNSTGHRDNILNCSIKAIGVGLAYRGSTPYWTQDFGWQ